MNDLDFFRSRYNYDPLTGIVSFKVNTWGGGGKILVGTPVGCISGNRLITAVNRDRKGKHFKVHRIAWLLMTGAWPLKEIDHIDGDGTNNRWSNLRLATSSQQKMNRRMQSNNTSGFKGVTKHGSNWRAQIWKERKRINLGSYLTKEEAYAAYCKINSELHNHYGRII